MKNNVKFILKVFLVAILALSLLFAVSEFYKNGETYQGTYMGIEKFESVPDKIDYANFGPSYGMSCFDYNAVELNGKVGFNFSLTMQDLYHDYAIYKTYEDNFNDDAIIAITLSYFSFCSDFQAPSGTRYYKILQKKYIKDYTFEKHISARYFPAYGNGNTILKDVFKKMLQLLKSEDATTTGETVSNNTMSEAELCSDSIESAVSIEDGRLKKYANNINLMEEVLVQWIEQMQKKGLKPILVLTPYWHEYANGFDEKILEESYIDPVERTIKKTGVDYVNFCSTDYDEYIHTPEFFSNCDHVSEKGAKAFMELYIDYIKKKEVV